MNTKTLNEPAQPRQHPPGRALPPISLKCPGLTGKSRRLQGLAAKISRQTCALDFKHETPVLWCVLAGGTGTGKSTIFNAMCGQTLSATGVERPMTAGALAYIHESFHIVPAGDCLLPPVEKITCSQDSCIPTAGTPERLKLLVHQRPDLKHIVLTDTPDIDSINNADRSITRDIALLADFVVYVTSQEKYADKTPVEFLGDLVSRSIPCIFVLNKAAPETSLEEIKEALNLQGIHLPAGRISIIPYGLLLGGTVQYHLERTVTAVFEECSPDNAERHRMRSIKRLRSFISQNSSEAIEIIQEEMNESKIWLERLNALHSRTCKEFLRTEEARLTGARTRHLRAQVRKVFSRYDVLAGPRRFLQSALSFPLRLFGLGYRVSSRARKEDLASMRGRLDLAPLFGALESFNCSVLDSLSPGDASAPLYSLLRGTPVLDESEVREKVADAQRDIEKWLASTFQELERKLPRSKKWGLYTTAVMWGVLVVSLEAALGGGFTVIDAAVGSALAPLATKGAVELFALREIQRIAQELSRRLRDGLLSVLDEQKKRYENTLLSLTPNTETIQRLERLAQAESRH